jgi:hypothetical protein
MRTPTDQPRSRTPSGPQRLKSPTAERTKPATTPPRLRSTPEKSVWTANLDQVEHLDTPRTVVTLGPIPEPEQKGMMFAIVAGRTDGQRDCGSDQDAAYLGHGCSSCNEPLCS